MALVDELKFHIKAGDGGHGVVRWRHEKGRELAGPSGGNGGRGGDVYIKAVRDLAILARYRNTKDFVAPKGEDGFRDSMHGKEGKDLVIDLPIGSVVTDLRTERKINLIEEGKLVKILNGGAGGLGNEHFKASTNTSPEESTPGKSGEEADFLVELELVADGGLIGLPNAGKSSLLNAITNANAKVGNYAFTTLEPNLGALPMGFVLADIPGLIEGASTGKGLGHKFLRHVKRTKRLFHLISLENEDPIHAYKTIRKELREYGQELDQKDETIILTKADISSTDKIEVIKKQLFDFNKDILSISILDDEAVKKLSFEIVERLRK